ncbi:MAG: hypothetical protein QOE33_3617, partial [Acidobacteriota bacterium]|nr:hypothetical protein [Acidobacteriota bacterium]
APVPPADPAPVDVAPPPPADIEMADPAPPAKKTKGRRRNKLNVDNEMADPAATASAAPPPPVKKGRGRPRKKVIEANTRPASAAEAPPLSTDAAAPPADAVPPPLADAAAAPTDAIPAPPPANTIPPPPADAAPSQPHLCYACCGILNARISYLENFVGNLFNQMRNESKELTKSVNNLEVRLSHVENYLEAISADSEMVYHPAHRRVIPAIEVVDATPEVSEEEADMSIDPTLLQ